MSLHADALLAILLMGMASYLCRFGGYFLMGYVAVTPRVDAWLRAIPIALIGAILGPIAVKGGLAEWFGLATAIVGMRVTGNDLVSAVAAIAVVAGVRALQG
jgi:uncharacterized membrane protein